MPGLLIKNVPPDLHRKLKESATLHHRSLTKEALALLEDALGPSPHAPCLPPPIRLKAPITKKFIDSAKREGRE